MTPFGLQRGTVRAIIALTLAVGLAPVVVLASDSALAAYTGIAGFVLRDYFATRQTADIQEGPAVREAVSARDVE